VRSSAAARRYARALFSIARDDDAIASVRGELDAMGDLFRDAPELRRALFRPLHPVKERRAVLTGVCERAGSSESVRKFLVYLIDQRRLVDFDAIRAEFARLADEAAGRIKANVIAARDLPPLQRERLRSALARRTGREVDLTVQVDPNLIGGAIAKVGDVVFDGSLRKQLSQLRHTLTRG
jgi:F-type H+-transporting ATPase subunit delta